MSDISLLKFVSNYLVDGLTSSFHFMNNISMVTFKCNYQYSWNIPSLKRFIIRLHFTNLQPTNFSHFLVLCSANNWKCVFHNIIRYRYSVIAQAAPLTKYYLSTYCIWKYVSKHHLALRQEYIKSLGETLHPWQPLPITAYSLLILCNLAPPKFNLLNGFPCNWW